MADLITFIAIDDDPLGLMSLNELASRYPWLQHKGNFSNAGDGMAAIISFKPLLVFLDIEMPLVSGLEFLKLAKDRIPMAVFVTSHAEFAVDGFELSALDYLLKPVSEERFARTMIRVQEYWQMKQHAVAFELQVEKESLLIKDGRNTIRLPQQDIIYLEAMQDYTKIVSAQKNYLVNISLTGFMERLPLDKFLRIHRSYAVPLQKIKEFRLAEVSGDGFTLPVGKTYRSALAQIRLK